MARPMADFTYNVQAESLGLKVRAKAEPRYNSKQLFPVKSTISGFTV